jgi:rhomboid protease GluP
VVYLGAGLTGSIASYLLLQHPAVSVGASGAIFGLIGATAAYLIRHQRDFHARLRWRARRVYIPLTLAVTLYSLTSGNFFAHGGGFVGGAILAALLDRPWPEDERPTLPTVSPPLRGAT